MPNLPTNPASAFTLAARRILQAQELADASAQDRSPKKSAYSAAAVARVVGADPAQWSHWTSGHKPPNSAAITKWLTAWQAAEHPPLVVVTTAEGTVVLTAPR